MRRETQNLVLLLVGVSILMVTVTGAYTRYVKPAMLPWLATAGLLIIGLGNQRNSQRHTARSRHA